MGLPNGRKKFNTLYCMAESDKDLIIQAHTENPMRETAYTLSATRLARKLKMMGKGKKISFRLVLSGHGQNIPEAQAVETVTGYQPTITSYTRVVNPLFKYDVDLD
jgi:hypothetical protein